MITPFNLNDDCDLFLNKVFKKKGLERWGWVYDPPLDLASVNPCSEISLTAPRHIEFYDAKDQFRFELLGGNNWVASLESKWLDSFMKDPFKS